MRKSMFPCTIFVIALTACWGNTPSLNEPTVPVVSNGYTGLKDETFEFNLSPANTKRPRPAVADKGKIQSSSPRLEECFHNMMRLLPI